MAVSISTHSLTETSYSVANNTSQVRYLVKLKTSSGSFNYNTITTTYYINGVKYTSNHTLPPDSTTTIVDKTVTVTHNSDGTKTVSANYSCPTDISVGTLKGSKSLTLTTIPRQSKLTIPSTFNVDSTLKLTITKYSSSFTDSLIVKLGSTKVASRSSVTDGTNFSFTATERNNIYNLMKTLKTATLNFTITTKSGSTTIGTSSANTTAQILNANPIFTDFDYYDIGGDTTEENLKTFDLTGDNKTVIRGHSKIFVDLSGTYKAIAQKGAEIQYYTINGNKYDSTIQNVTIDKFDTDFLQIYAVDSRGNSTYVKKSLNFINWDIITKNEDVTVSREDGIGSSTDASYSIKFWNGDFGVYTNTLSASYKYRVVGTEEFSEDKYTIDPFISENIASFKGGIIGDTIDGFDIKNAYEIVFTFKDKLETREFSVILSSGIPAIAVKGNYVALHGKYDDELGGTQLNGDVYLDGQLLNPFYKKGETVDIVERIYIVAGDVTNSTTLCRFTLITPKLLSNISSIKINALKGNARNTTASKYLDNKNYVAGGNDYLSLYTCSAYKSSENSITVEMEKSSAMADTSNNTPVSVALEEFNVTFN